MMPRSWSLPLSLVLMSVELLLAGPGGAQEPVAGSDVFQEEIVVREVTLDVVVTDRSGNVIVGLDKSDFVVEEEGEEVDVTDVTFYSSRPVVERGAEVAARNDRYFIFLFHDPRASAPALISNQLDAARYAREWVASELEPEDRVAVLSYDYKLKVFTDFTDDRARLDEAIARAATGKKEIESWPSRTGELTDEDSPSLLENLPYGKELRKKSNRFQKALRLVGEAATGFVGRKNLILFSPGFEGAGGAVTWIPDPRYYPDMQQALNDGNVAVYAIDLIAIRTVSRPAGGISDSLNQLAADTGGEYYFAFTNVMTPLKQVLQDNEAYYMLAYQSRFPAGEKGYRKVEVKAREGNWKVRARGGYLYGGS